MMLIEIASPEWTTQAIAEGYADDETLTEGQTWECADTEVAWLINHTHEYMPGWSFANGTFSGPARNDALAEIMSLFVAASDYVVEHLDEILGEDANA